VGPRNRYYMGVQTPLPGNLRGRMPVRSNEPTHECTAPSANECIAFAAARGDKAAMRPFAKLLVKQGFVLNPVTI